MRRGHPAQNGWSERAGERIGATRGGRSHRYQLPARPDRQAQRRDATVGVPRRKGRARREPAGRGGARDRGGNWPADPRYRRHGSRVHPRTGVRIAYVAAVLVSGADAQISEVLTDYAGPDGQELNEVRWASVAEAEELMGDMFAMVRQHLRRTFGC
jgi:hypothetical protein